MNSNRSTSRSTPSSVWAPTMEAALYKVDVEEDYWIEEYHRLLVLCQNKKDAPRFTRTGTPNALFERHPHEVNGLFSYSASSSIYFLKNGAYHREDGPAWLNSVGQREWFIDGDWHREDGPCVLGVGQPVNLYKLHGKIVSKEAHELHYMLKYNRSYDGE